MTKIVEITNVSKSYGRKQALNDISIEFEPGNIYGLLGPNGSGKTTLLKLLLHIIRANEGTLTVNNENISYLTRKHFSYMPDKEYLYDNMAVKDAIKYYQDMFIDFDTTKSSELCSKLGLNIEDDISKLSKGNKEKVNLMLTLSRKTSIYLLDEPLGSLDPVIKHQMLDVIKSQKASDNIIIIATHLIKDTEVILDKAVLLKEGKLLDIVDTSSLNNKSLDDHYMEVFTNA